MKKCTTLVEIILKQYFTYRFTFIMWRLSTILNITLTYFLWHSLYTKNTLLFGYSREQMLTYILLINIISNFVLSSRTGDLSAEIVMGTIVNYLLKPIPFFSYLATREITFKMLNVICGCIEMSLLYLLFKPDLYIQTNILAYILIIGFIVIGSLIAFFISVSFSFIAFWSPETWAPRFVYMVLLSLIAGTLFPLDILPKPLFTILSFTPFPYLLYLPTKLYLNGPSIELLKPFIISLMWVGILYLITKKIWQKGLKICSFYGR